MKYVMSSKLKSKMSFVEAVLNKLLKLVDDKLEAMRESSIKAGNQNWKKSKLAIIFLTMKTLIHKILTLREKKPQNPEQEKAWKKEAKKLLLELKVTTKLANNEMQVQREKNKGKALTKVNQKTLSPIELEALVRQQQYAYAR